MKEKIKIVSNIPLYEIDSVFVAIISTDTQYVTDIGTTIESFRKMFPEVMIQGINPKYIFGKDYFEEQLARIRDIRSSERRFYQKNTDIYAECSAD